MAEKTLKRSISAKFIRLVGVYLRSNLNKKHFVVISISNKRTEFILNLLWHLSLVSCCQDWLKSLQMRIYTVPLQKLTEKVQSVAYIEYKGSQLYCNTRMCLRKIRPKTMLFNK